MNREPSFIKDDLSKLKSFSFNYEQKFDLKETIEALKQDFVVKISGVEERSADSIIYSLSEQLGLLESLKLQTSFVSVMGHRKNKGEYYSTVNERKNYHCIPAHSEGSSKTNFQLASMYCQENTTDGGLSILTKVKQDDSLWERLGEYSIKVRPGHKQPTRLQIEQAKAFFKVDLEKDFVQPEDKIIDEVDPKMLKMIGLYELGFKAYNVISKIPKTYSSILNKELYSYWDTVASNDASSWLGYFQLLEQNNLVKKPNKNTEASQFDNAAERRIWDSGVNFMEVIGSKLTLKLQPGEIIFFNNLSWTHSCTNWTPNSGVRNVFAAFA